MDDLTPVKGPPTPFEGRSAKVLGLVLIALLVAIIKPWGSGSEAVAPPPVAASAPASPAAPVAAAASPTPFDPWANYDHEIFGIYEPEPRWELWPAGYLVSFGYAFRIESGSARQTPGGVASPAPGPSEGPTASTLPGASGRPLRPALGDGAAAPGFSDAASACRVRRARRRTDLAGDDQDHRRQPPGSHRRSTRRSAIG